ncbi:MAG TPA: hypothetical protein VKB69_03760, partial [Micromonosporaceae bacterium]|nr:hypothetical protein [Micromonosporaceae bacterium]
YSWERAPRPYLLASELPRMSSGTAFGIVLAVAALGASATGVLAPEGFLVGIFGLAFCLVGLAAGRGDGVPGRGLAVFGMLCAGAAMGLGAAAVTHQFAWPNSHIDAVAQAHAWVAAHLSWLNL